MKLQHNHDYRLTDTGDGVHIRCFKCGKNPSYKEREELLQQSRMLNPLVIRIRARQKGITGYRNVMRPTKMRNPFSIEKYGVEESLKKYEEYLRARLERDKWFAHCFDSLLGKKLGCTCKLENPCHIDIMEKLLGERFPECPHCGERFRDVIGTRYCDKCM